MMPTINLKEARSKLRLTQAQMGAMLGYQGENIRQMVYDIESGRRELMPCQRRLVEAYLDGYRPKDWPIAEKGNARVLAGPKAMQPNQIGPLAPGEAEKWEDYKRIRNMDTDGT